MNRTVAILAWIGLALAILVPVLIAAGSPLLQWRQPIYIAAGFAGILGMGALLVQPLLVGGYLPGIRAWRGRRIHKFVGAALILMVLVHVVGLWITSPPDMIDALTFTAPTLFSVFGVISMWALFGAAGFALARRHVGPRVWRIAHSSCVGVAVVTAVLHALQIEGTMGTISKTALCVIVLGATAKALFDLNVWRRNRRSRST